MTPAPRTYVFALSYLADYRTLFFDALERDLDGELHVMHPEVAIDPSIRIVDRHNSIHTAPVRTVLGGLHTRSDLVRDVAHQRPNAVVIESSSRDISYLRLLVWCRVRRIPVAIWGLGRSNRNDRSLVDRVAGEVLIAAQVLLSNRVIGKGQGPADYYKRLARNDAKVAFAPNSSGIEERLERITWSPRGRVDSQAPLRVLFVGRVTARKDVNVLIDALHHELPTDSWRLDVVGQGDAIPSLQEQVKALGCADNVQFHGPLQGDNLVARYADADVLALPGKGGLVIPEAFAAGLPVLLGPLEHSGDGTLENLISSGKNAFVAPSADAEGQRHIIRKLVNLVNAGEYEATRMAAREAFSQHGGVAAMSVVFADFLRGNDKN